MELAVGCCVECIYSFILADLYILTHILAYPRLQLTFQSPAKYRATIIEEARYLIVNTSTPIFVFDGSEVSSFGLELLVFVGPVFEVSWANGDELLIF